MLPQSMAEPEFGRIKVGEKKGGGGMSVLSVVNAHALEYYFLNVG